jgi:hypothetical protein
MFLVYWYALLKITLLEKEDEHVVKGWWYYYKDFVWDIVRYGGSTSC